MRLRQLAILMAALLAAACEKAPTEPMRDLDAEIASLSPGENTPFGSSPSTLRQLFRAAVEQAELERGRGAVQDLLKPLRELNEQARDALHAGDRPTAQARIAAIRDEELRLVLLLSGNGIAYRVLEDVGLELIEAKQGLEQAAGQGTDVSGPAVQAGEATLLLARANAAYADRDYKLSLDLGTRAAALINGIDHFLIGLNRIVGLEGLLQQAIARVARTQGTEGVSTLLAPLQTLREEAARAVRNGSRELARQKLGEVRTEQLRIIIDVLGDQTAGMVSGKVSRALAELRPVVGEAGGGTRVQRARRMLTEASDLNARAQKAIERGQYAPALDLALHAAGLVDAVRHLLPR